MNNGIMQIIGGVFAITIAVGILSFYLAGGIPALSNDVGASGAWGILIFFNLIYSMYSVVGFLLFALITRKYTIFSASIIPAMISSLIITASINLYAIYQSGPDVDFVLFTLLCIVSSTVTYAISTAVFNSLTRHSKSTAKSAAL